jgi:aminoglycoside 3-N-acetyltransferase
VSTVTSGDLVAGIRRLGLSGRPVCVHSSLRSFGHVTGAADAVVDAFLTEGCTLLVPSFSFRFLVLPPEGLRPRRNAWDYDEPPPLAKAERYTPATIELDGHMGAVPRSVVTRPGRARGAHPLCSFTALGPAAAELVGGQTPQDVYAPLRSLVEHEGLVVLLGVGLTSLTLLHHAEQLAGRTLFRRWALRPDGERQMVPVGGCSNGFDAFAPVLAPLLRHTSVGSSRWSACEAAGAVAAAVDTIRAEPDVTRCDDAECVRCRDGIAGGPILASRGQRSP